MYKKIYLSLAIVVCCSHAGASASAGTLDTTFNPSGTPPGTVTTNIGGVSSNIKSIAIQQDGKIIAAGDAVVGGMTRFAVARYNSDGSLDTTFNGTGEVITPIGTTADARGVALQQDGKIVVAGFAVIAGVPQFAVARYNTNGSLDTTFNGTGIVPTPIGTSAVGSSVTIQQDGKIVVAGTAVVAGVPQFAVVRYNTDGSLDTTFNGTGKVITDIGGNSGAESVVIQQDGKIVAAGTATIAGNGEVAVARYNTDGSLDTTFSPSGTPPGTVTILIGDASDGHSVQLQQDGKIVVAADAVSGGVDQFAVARYNTDGSLDTTFNGTGTVLTNIGGVNSQAFGVAIQHDGRVVAVGFATVTGVIQFAVARYNTNGSLDTTFNGTGIVTTAIGTTTEGNAVAIQKDGKIVVAGTAQVGGVFQFAVARYLGIVVNTCAMRLIEKYGPRL